MVAVKRIDLQDLSEDEISNLMKELHILKRLSHPGIVKYEGMARAADTINIVLEYAFAIREVVSILTLIRYVENGSLGRTIKAFGKLNERLVASYITKVLDGLHYLHTSHVVHCNLKAENILTTKNGNVKLSDFGVSLNLRAKALEETRNDVAGTPNWSECVDDRSQYVLTTNHSGPRNHRAQRTLDRIRYLVSRMYRHRTAHRTSSLS